MGIRNLLESVDKDTSIPFVMTSFEDGSLLSWLHFNTLAYQAVITTTRDSAWVNPGAAAFNAALTVYRHVCADSEVRAEKSFLIMDEGFKVSQPPVERQIPSDNNRPLTCWNVENLSSKSQPQSWSAPRQCWPGFSTAGFNTKNNDANTWDSVAEISKSEGESEMSEGEV